MKPSSIAICFAITIGGLAQPLFQWSDWIPTTEPSTDYRYELIGETQLSLQFRNGSKSPSHFDYEITIPGQDGTQHGNATVKSHKMSPEINVTTNRGRPPSKVLINSCDGASCKY
jgi:hypothetical protein